MRDRGKALEAYGGDLFCDANANNGNNNNNNNNFYSSSSGFPCKKHPSSSPIGVCAFCLRDRLVRLVCSDCGEQRLSSCSCSEIEAENHRSSCSAAVGSVGRMSFLIENDKTQSEDVAAVLKRSSSTCVGIKRAGGGFWKIGRLFRKRSGAAVSGGGDGEKSEMWVVDYMGVSRSRSLCSFRGANLYGGGSDDYLPVSAARSSVSAARSSGVNVGMALDSGRRSGFSEAEPRRSGYGYNSEAEPRKSGFSYNSEAEQRKSSFGYNSEAEPRRSGFSYNSEAEPRKSSFSYNSEAEPRKSNFDDHERKPNPITELNSGPTVPNRRIFSLKETDFSSDSGFIDLKFDFSSEPPKTEQSAVTVGALSAFGSMRSGGDENDRSFGNASCRIGAGERGIKRSRKSFKGWGWIFKNHPNSATARKKDDDVTFNPSYR